MGEAHVTLDEFSRLKPGDRIRLTGRWCGTHGERAAFEVVRVIPGGVGFRYRVRLLYPSTGARPLKRIGHANTPGAWEHLT